jgi:PhnB protein
MRSVNPYLNFDGRSREAIEFYASVFGGTPDIRTFGDAGMAEDPAMAGRTMHAVLDTGALVLMASDTMSGTPLTAGNNVWINLNCESAEEISRLFAGLAEGGEIVMALADQFWGATFGMVRDRFGIHWMFNYEKPS